MIQSNKSFPNLQNTRSCYFTHTFLYSPVKFSRSVPVLPHTRHCSSTHTIC
ncbi:hypothetical protein Hanom_Chr00s000102g01621011 [Helianthus anomalus]